MFIDETAFLQQLTATYSFRGRLLYANTHLDRIGTGSGRVVFALDDQRVLKVAKNPKGVAQNRTEIDWAMIDMYGDVVAKWLDFPVGPDGDNSGLWVISERAEKTTKKRFRQITGVALEDFCYALKKFDSRNNPQDWRWFRLDAMAAAAVARTEGNEFTQQFTSLIGDFDLPVGDFCRISTFGEVVRDSVRRIVAVDVGLTREVYAQFYAPKKKSYF